MTLDEIAARGSRTLGGGIRPPAARELQPTRGVTFRAVVAALLITAAIVCINPYTAFIKDVWNVGDGGMLQGPIQVAFLFLVLNTVLLRFAPKRAFSRSELLVIYGILIIALATVYGSQTALVSFIPYPQYMATAENGWASLILPRVPSWLAVSDARVVPWFWEGLPEGQPLPWGAWLVPLLAVSSFYFALMVATYCLGGLVSRDWMERQRLAFPMAEVPLVLVGGDARPSLHSRLWRNKAFLIGLAIPAVINLTQWLNGIFPSLPYLNMAALDSPGAHYFAGMGLPWSVLADLRARLLWRIIGVACLAPAEVSLSLWLFHILFRGQMLVWASFGVVADSASASGFDPHVFTGFMEAGGFVVLSAIILYQSRQGFAAAWRGLCGLRAPQTDDPYAPLSGRGSLLGFIAANAFMLWWLIAAGGSWWYFAGVLVFVYIYALGAARLIAAGGVLFLSPDISLMDLGVRTVGGATIGARSLTIDTYAQSMFLDEAYSMNQPMTHMLTSFRVLRASRTSARYFALAAAAGVVVMLGVGLPALLEWAHRGGAIRLNSWYFGEQAHGAFGQLDTALRNPVPASNILRLAVLLGAAVMLGLTYMHMHFLWWPLSPIGFVIASSEITNRVIWANFLIGWLANTIIRRAGGFRLYLQVRPAFVGLVLGDILTRLVLLLLGLLFTAQVSGG
jgi:hypothetical protein